MDNAGELDYVAGQLRRVATNFTNTVHTLEQQTGRLDTIAQDLTTGMSQWAGLGSDAFLGAWSQYHQDTLISAVTLAQVALSLTTLAQTIEDNTPTIVSGQQIKEQSYLQEQNPALYESSMQAMQTAEFAIAMMAANMTAQLEALTPKVGSCSEPENSLLEQTFGGGNASSDGESGGSEVDGGNKENDDELGATTPEGRPLSKHSESSLPRHRMTPEQVDDAIDNYSRKTTQSDGATVYIQKQLGRGNRYSIVIESNDGTIVTGIRDLNPSELAALGKRYGFNPNP